MTYENINFREANMTYHDGYFYFFDDSFDVLYQKVADGDTAFTYPLSDDLSTHIVYDDFTGASGNSLNPAYWNLSSSVIFDNNVRFNETGSASRFNGKDKTVLAGNFDMRIDFDLISTPSTNYWEVILDVIESSTRFFRLARTYSNGNKYYFGYWDGGPSWIQFTSVPGSQTSGKLRFTRSGNTFTGYYWNGSSWTVISSRSESFSHILYPRVGGQSYGSNPSITIDVDNFWTNIPIGSPVQTEHDGINFWTMQSYAGNAGVLARRWQTSNYTCDLKEQRPIISNFDSEAFTVEHYHTVLSTAVSGGDTLMQTDLYYNTTIVSGSVLTLGPNSSNQYEDVEVVSVSGVDITLSSGVQNDYGAGDSVNFYNNLWIFNSYAAGTLHKVSARTGVNITTYSGISYDDISACTFSRVRHVTTSRVDSLIYINDSNLTYLDIDNIAVPYDTMTIDTLKPPATYIKVYDMALDGNNIYRLQSEARYYETNYVWSTYNYVISTVRRFIGSVSLSAYPTILPANGVNVSDLSTIVQDQYGDGMISKPVFFTDTDSVGFITTTPAYTDYFFGTGEAVSAYKAGITNGAVTIEATATQYD